MRPLSPLARGALLALLAAVLFGATTPLVQAFGVHSSPFVTAALLYAGAALASVPRSSTGREASLRRADAPRLLLVAGLGAVLAPVALAAGLQRTDGGTASLLLNFEAIFTVACARLFYAEPVGRRVVAAASLMVLGGGVLSLRGGRALGADALGMAAVTLAALGWALDNTLTRPLADRDPRSVVFAKASIGALSSLVLARVFGGPLPSPRAALGLLACGATGYGLSLRLYLLAQRRLGAARTGSVFAFAPFVGAAIAFAMGAREAPLLQLVAALLFAAAVVLHVTEDHAHRHRHAPVRHEHAHRHDDGHHDHAHDPPFVGAHSHEHLHDALEHEHPHGPDLHHAHDHE